MKYALPFLFGLILVPFSNPAQAEKAKVVCFGDSITNRGYFRVLEELLAVEAINAGKGGHSSAMGLRRMQTDVIEHKPDVVVVMFGTNDLRADSERVFVPVEKYKENLQTIVSSCREHGSKVVLCTIPPINEQKFFTRHERAPFDAMGGFSSVVQSYRNAAREVATEHDVPLVDLNQLLTKQPEWLSQDGVHPSETGTKLIAEHVAKTVQGLVDDEPIRSADVCVYGGTASGVITAVQVARMGKSVVLIEPGKSIGGMTSGGLGNTDIGKQASIGGLTREFYQAIRDWYQEPEHWKFQSKDQYKWKGDRVTEDAWFVFEPHVAELKLHGMLEAANVPVVLGERLDLNNGVKKEGSTIIGIRMESGREFAAKVFIDCTYEGDLMAKAGVSYTIGREPNSQYGESINGVQTTEPSRRGPRPLDPFVIPGDASSGVIKGLLPDVIGKNGDGDKRVQAYNYRLCLTSVPENRVPFEKPAGYDESEYELLFRWLETGAAKNVPLGSNPIPNGKTDTNKAGWVSTDCIGMCDDYPDADYQVRQRITDAHIRYHKGLLWTLANHPRIPEDIRSRAAKLGYAKDEFVDNDHFTHQLYVRKGRRMLGRMIMTEHELRKKRKIEDPVALGSYGMDSHPTQVWVDADGALHADTPKWTGVGDPYGISYRAITPKIEECSNLLVTTCISASHSAYGSIRMEPVYMMLGQASATAAALSVDENSSVQDVPYQELREQLLKDGQILVSGK